MCGSGKTIDRVRQARKNGVHGWMVLMEDGRDVGDGVCDRIMEVDSNGGRVRADGTSGSKGGWSTGWRKEGWGCEWRGTGGVGGLDVVGRGQQWDWKGEIIVVGDGWVDWNKADVDDDEEEEVDEEGDALKRNSPTTFLHHLLEHVPASHVRFRTMPLAEEKGCENAGGARWINERIREFAASEGIKVLDWDRVVNGYRWGATVGRGCRMKDEAYNALAQMMLSDLNLLMHVDKKRIFIDEENE
ncbi:hypothetical protein HK101_002305 [Irineochytrium annulatum]|nr:hypothetical protein HK101_002305 [Irineochytrium annulatum]